MKQVPYNPNKLIYQTIFTKTELLYLELLNHHSKSEYLLSEKNIEAFSIDFAHTSAVLEGNTYTPTEAQMLLTLGQTAGSHKQFNEAVMLKNMHKSFKYLVDEVRFAGDGQRPFVHLVKNAHTLVSEMLLDKQNCGVVRKEPVLISASSYVPSDIPQQLEDGLECIARWYDKIENTFEKAVYAHQNLAYLQYFYDHNKRTARNICAYTLMADDKMPVMFTQRSAEEYARAVISYYENEPTDYSAFAKYFITSYEHVCSRMNIHAVEQSKSLLNVATGNLKHLYPTLTDEQVQKTILFADDMMSRLSSPQAQIAFLEQLKDNVADVASGKITLPDFPIEYKGKDKGS